MHNNIYIDSYKVSAILTDITDSATIFMTDEAARALTNISSQDIINMYPNEDMKKLPPPLQKSKGSTKKVYIQCKNPSTANNIRFAITSTTNIESIKSTLTSPANVPVTPSTTMDQTTKRKTKTQTTATSHRSGKQLCYEETGKQHHTTTYIAKDI